MTPRELLAIRFADPVKRRDLLTVVNMIETEVENRVAEAVEKIVAEVLAEFDCVLSDYQLDKIRALSPARERGQGDE